MSTVRAIIIPSQTSEESSLFDQSVRGLLKQSRVRHAITGVGEPARRLAQALGATEDPALVANAFVSPKSISDYSDFRKNIAQTLQLAAQDSQAGDHVVIFTEAKVIDPSNDHTFLGPKFTNILSVVDNHSAQQTSCLLAALGSTPSPFTNKDITVSFALLAHQSDTKRAALYRGRWRNGELEKPLSNIAASFFQTGVDRTDIQNALSR